MISRLGLCCALVLCCACGSDDDATGPDQLRRSDLTYDWTAPDTNDTWSFDTNGQFLFFGGDPLDFDSDFQGTWTLDGDRITLTVEGRGTLLLQVILADKVLTVTRLCDESGAFYEAEDLAACRANPIRALDRASLFDL